MSNKIGIIVGSVRKESFSKKIADEIATLFPENVELVFPKISDLEMFNQDYDDEGVTPTSWTRFRQEIKELDGVVFVTPEYNRSMPPVLKNALDIASRPYGENGWNDKPGMIISVSTGAIGGFGANHHLRQVLSFLNIHMMDQPEVYLGQILNFLNEDGTVKEDTKGFLQSVVESYMVWFNRLNK